MEIEDDVISIGKLRRPGHPGVAVSYDPSWGIRVEDEDVPREPAAAAAWCRKTGGFLRVYASARKSTSVTVADFIHAWRKR